MLDASEFVARHVGQFLAQSDIASVRLPGEPHFYVSDYTAYFEASNQLFFQQKVKLEHYQVWE